MYRDSTKNSREFILYCGLTAIVSTTQINITPMPIGLSADNFAEEFILLCSGQNLIGISSKLYINEIRITTNFATEHQCIGIMGNLYVLIPSFGGDINISNSGISYISKSFPLCFINEINQDNDYIALRLKGTDIPDNDSDFALILEQNSKIFMNLTYFMKHT